ncbi:MAG: GNAT family N-acetyltransferase [Chitinophagaceae bacterium]|nr:GNAT family N-acetyltransferase [Chitinophagaceae bacterium]
MIYSESESNRFGLNVYRLNVSSDTFENLEAEMLDLDVDILIIRIATNLLDNFNRIILTEYSKIFTDTLVYYSKKLTRNLNYEVRNERFSWREAKTGDIPKIVDLVKSVFENYQNHYTANPVFKYSDILDGYTEWTLRHIESENKNFFLVEDINQLVGFACCSYKDAHELEGVIFGVSNDYSGMGVYTDMIRYTQNYFSKEGFQNMVVSTQVQNQTVQRVWTKEGFQLDHSYFTFHLCRLQKPHANPLQ